MRTLSRVLIAAALAFGLGCASSDWIDRTLVTVDVTGTWHGSMGGGGTPHVVSDFILELEQQGSTVKGSIRFIGGANMWGLTGGPIDGTVAGDVFRFRDRRGNLEVEVTDSGDEMNGLGSSSIGGSRPILLRRIDSSPRLGSPTR